MKRFGIILAAIAAVFALAAAPAQAQLNRTFVSGHGDDSNPCTVTFPCRSFAYAITQTNAGGEIATLDAAGYGLLTITKAISITNDGAGEAGISVGSAVAGITITAGFTDVVNLRGLTLTGNGVGTDGISFTSGGTLNVKNCIISGFSGTGVNLTPNASSNFNVSDMIVSNNGGDGVHLVPTTSGTTNQATFERVQSLGHAAGSGFLIDGSSLSSGTLRATAVDSVARNNLYGFVANGSAVVPVFPTFTLVNAKAVDNADGVTSQGSTVILAKSTISGNSSRGFVITFGPGIQSFGDNYIIDTSNHGSLTSVAEK